MIKPAEKQEPAPPTDGRGLLLVDLLSLHRTFSLRGYREDVLGFIAAWLFVAVNIGLALLAGWVGSR